MNERDDRADEAEVHPGAPDEPQPDAGQADEQPARNQAAAPRNRQLRRPGRDR